MVDSEINRRGLSGVDVHAVIMQRLIEQIIRAGIDPSVGGGVAVLILERDRPARWFHQTDACKS